MDRSMSHCRPNVSRACACWYLKGTWRKRCQHVWCWDLMNVNLCTMSCEIKNSVGDICLRWSTPFYFKFSYQMPWHAALMSVYPTIHWDLNTEKAFLSHVSIQMSMPADSKQVPPLVIILMSSFTIYLYWEREERFHVKVNIRIGFLFIWFT